MEEIKDTVIEETEQADESSENTEAVDAVNTDTSEEISEEPVVTAESDEENVDDKKNAKNDKKKLKKAEAEINTLRKALEEKDAACADMNDKYLRICAEYDNFRKRSSKEMDAKYADACCDVLTQILPVLDNLDRAVQYNTEDSAQTPLGKGLELTLKSFQELLQKLGVSEIEALGKQFDPNVHNAVMHVDDENFGENEIVEVFMKGYAKGDKVLRYSMVKVAN